MGLKRRLTSLTRENFRLQRELDAASDPCDEGDSLRVATLKARLVRMEEVLRYRDKMIGEKNAMLREREELLATLDTTLVDKSKVIEQLHHCLHRNYHNLVHLGSHCYHERDLAERLQLAWECSDRRRAMELEELRVWVPCRYRKELCVESFALPPTKLYTQVLHPPARVATKEMTRVVSTLSQLYGGDPLELPVYSDDESGPWRGPTPEYHPEDEDVDDVDFPCSD